MTRSLAHPRLCPTAVALTALLLGAPVLAGGSQKPARAPSGAPGAATSFSGLAVTQLTPGIHRRLKLHPTQVKQLASLAAREREEVGRLIDAGRGKPVGETYRKVDAARMRVQTDGLKLLSTPQRTSFRQVQQEFGHYDGLGPAAYRLLAITSITLEQRKQLSALGRSVRDRRLALIRAARTPAERETLGVRLAGLEPETTAGARNLLSPQQQKEFDAAVDGPGLPATSGGRASPPTGR